MIRLLTLIIFIFQWSVCLSQNVNLDWVAQIGGSQMDGATDLCLDHEGNVIIAGYYDGRLDVDPGHEYEYLEHLDGRDAYVVKLNPDGGLIWAIGLVGQEDNTINDIQVDDQGYIYVAGSFYGDIDVDPGNEVLRFNSKGQSDVFICKYHPNGQLVWAKEIGNHKYNFCNAFKIDESGNVWISINFSQTIDCDPNEAVVTLESFNDRYDFFLLKLNTEGEFEWVQHFEGESYENATDIDLDSQGNLYLSGYFYGNIDLDPTDQEAMFYSKGGDDLFICKLNPFGNLLWAYSLGGDEDDVATNLRLDRSGHYYISGTYNDIVDFDPGPGELNLGGDYYNGFIAKYHNDGQLIWAQNVSNPSSAKIADMEIDEQGNVFATGYYRIDCDFDPSDDEYMVTSTNGMEDIFMMSLNPQGALIWAKGLLGTGQDHGYDIEIDEHENVYTVGAFGNSVDFDPDEEVKKVIAKGYWDGFVHKMNHCYEEYQETRYSCNAEYISPSGLVWNSPGTYIDSVIAPHICQSYYTIDLSFVEMDNSVHVSSNTLRANLPNAQYQWLYFDQEGEAAPINGADGQTYTAITGGHYAVIIELNGCVDTSAFYKLDDILFGEVEMRKITVYPNPSSGILYVNFGGGLFEDFSVQVFNIYGELILEKEIENDYDIELQILEQGIYSIKMDIDNRHTLFKKVIIH